MHAMCRPRAHLSGERAARAAWDDGATARGADARTSDRAAFLGVDCVRSWVVMSGKTQADFRAMLLGSKLATQTAEAPTAGGAQSYEQAMAAAGGDAAKITGLVMPKQRPPRHADSQGGAASQYGARKPNNRRMQESGEKKKARKEAKRKDSDQFELVCPKEDTVARIDAFVREYKAGPNGGDVRSMRTLDMLHISAFRPGFELSDSAEGLKWKLKLTVTESGLFTAEETARGVQHGDKTVVRAAVDGGFERKSMWEFFEQMKGDVCRTNRKWRRIQQRGKDIAAHAGEPNAAAPQSTNSAATSNEPAESPAPAEPIDLSQFGSQEQLLFKGPGAQALKMELQRLGLKCGGAPAERAARLYRTKDFATVEDFKKANPQDVAQAGGKKKRKRKVGGNVEAAAEPKSAAIAGFTEADQERIATQATEIANARQFRTGLGFG